MSEYPDFRPSMVDDAKKIEAAKLEASLREENVRLLRQNQIYRRFIHSLLGEPFVQMASETKEA